MEEISSFCRYYWPLHLSFIHAARTYWCKAHNLKNALSIAEARSYFETQIKNKTSKVKGKSVFTLKSTETNLWQDVLTDINPVWDVAKFKGLHNGSNAVVTPIYKKGVYVKVSEKKMVKFGFLNYLMMYKDANENIITEWIELKPTERWIDSKVSRKYEGKIIVRNWNGSIKKVYSYSNGAQSLANLGLKGTKLGTTTMGDGDSDGGNDVDDPLLCYVTTNITISVAAKLCPCEAHTFAQYAECRCGTKPQQGYNTTIEVVAEYDCSVGIPDDPPVGGGTGGGNNNGGGDTGSGDPNSGGGGTSSSDYPPESCNSNAEYEEPTEPLPEGSEYAVPCSETSIPAEEPADEPTSPYDGLDVSSGVLDLAERLYLSYPEALFVESRQDIFDAIDGYLDQHSNSVDASEFAKWAVGYLYENPNENVSTLISAGTSIYYSNAEMEAIISSIADPITGNGIELYLILKYRGTKLFELSRYSRAVNSIEAGEYTLTPHYDKTGRLLFYAGSRLSTSISRNGIEYIIKPNQLNNFITNVDYYTRAASLVYMHGIPNKGMIQMMAGDRVDGLLSLWSDAIRSPEYWMYLLTLYATNSASTNAGQRIVNSVESATTSEIAVLGKWPTYLEVAESLGARRFSIPMNVWNNMTVAEQWAANVRFLDRAVARGSDFILATPVKNINSVTGAYRSELEYLINNKGYILNSTGTRLIKKP